MRARNCPFCGTSSPTLLLEPSEEWTRIGPRILPFPGASSIALCAGLGAIAEPYILAYSREHYTSIAELSSTSQQDLIHALDACLASGLFASQTLAVFEHGGTNAENGSTCLEHCHLHIVDGQYDLREDLRRYYPEATATVFNVGSVWPHSPGYLFAGLYQAGGSISGMLVSRPGCGSQFLRQLWASKAGSVSWNWRTVPNPAAAFSLCEAWKRRQAGKT